MRFATLDPLERGVEAFSRRARRSRSELHVLELERLAVDALRRRRDPARDLPGRVDRLHQRLHVRALRVRGEPLADATLPRRLVDRLSVDVEAARGPVADLAVEAPVGEAEPELDA